MLQMRHHTSRLLLAAATLLAALAFSSCERDKYLDWKYINQSWYDEHKNDEGWHTTESGLMYRVIYDGIGDLKPGSKSAVLVSYRGTYFNGNEFDSGEMATLSVSGVVEGFAEGLKMMRKNAIYEFRIPQELGYGEEGSSPIPPYTTLIFRVELHDFQTLSQGQ